MSEGQDVHALWGTVPRLSISRSGAARQGGDASVLPWTGTEDSMVPCMTQRTSGALFRASELCAKVRGAMGGSHVGTTCVGLSGK